MKVTLAQFESRSLRQVPQFHSSHERCFFNSLTTNSTYKKNVSKLPISFLNCHNFSHTILILKIYYIPYVCLKLSQKLTNKKKICC